MGKAGFGGLTLAVVPSVTTARPWAVIALLAAGLGLGGSARGQVAPLGGQFQVNTYTTSNRFGPAVTGDGAGNFVVVWTSYESAGSDTSNWSIQGQRYDATGAPVGGEFQVNTYTTGGQYRPTVAGDGAGNFVVAWASYGSAGSDTSGWSIQGQRYDSAGTPVGGQFQVNTYTTSVQARAAVTGDGAGNFVVVWDSFGSAGSDTSGYSIQGQRYDSAGTPVGGQFQVNTYTTRFQSQPAATGDGAGNFVVVWESDGSAGSDTSGDSIQAQRYDSSGTPLGGQFQVNTYTTGNQRSPKVTGDGAGNFVVVWNSNGSAGSDTSSYSIQAQRYDATGTPVGGQFQVNTYTTGGQGSFYGGAGVLVDGAGNFVVVWQSNGSIQGQPYDSAGTPVGGQFQVNTYTTGRQRRPAVTGDGAGNFVVVWDSGSAGYLAALSIQGQRFTVTMSTSTSATSTTSSSTTSSSTTTSTTASTPSTTGSTTPTTTSTMTTSSTTTTLRVACVPELPSLCADGDTCTDDSCDPLRGCVHRERSPARPDGVTCGVENMRGILDEPPQPVCQGRCPLRLGDRLNKVAQLIDQGTSAPNSGRCKRKLRAAVRVAKALDQKVAQLADKGRLVPSERASRLSAEAAKLRVRANALAQAYCSSR